MTDDPHEGGQLATKDDVKDLKDRFDRLEDRFDRLEDRIDRLQETMRDQMKTYMVATIGAMNVNTAIFGTMLAVFR